MTEEIGRGILTRDTGASIAYVRHEGSGPGVVFLHGLRSDMTGGKAIAVEEWCKAQGRAFLKLDVSGHGQSSGRFEDGTIGQWADDAADAFDKLTSGPQIIVGSSMGGWLMLLVALRHRARVAGLVGIAAAPDFSEDLIYKELSAEQKQELLQKGITYLPSDWCEPMPLTRAFIEDGRNHLLLVDTINLSCPVRLIHGLKDEDVPWNTALRLQEQLASDDVEVTLVKDGGHRLSEPHDLDRLISVLELLVAKVG